MPLDTSFFAKDLAYAIRDLPALINAAGKIFACSISDAGNNQDAFEDVVISRMVTLQATCLLSDFSTPPEPEDAVLIQPTGSTAWNPFFIDSVTIHADGIGVSMGLRANQEAQ